VNGWLPFRATTPIHGPFIAKDIRHTMILNPKTVPTQKNGWE
jgi:hypothetical protein